MYLFFSQRDKEFCIVFYSTLLYKYVWNSVQTLEFLSCPVMKCYVYNQLCFPSYSYVGIGGVFGLPRWLSGNDCLPMQGDGGLILGLGRSTGEGSGNPLQYSCLKNSIDREAWLAIVPRVAKSQIQRACMQMGLLGGRIVISPIMIHLKYPKCSLLRLLL